MERLRSPTRRESALALGAMVGAIAGGALIANANGNGDSKEPSATAAPVAARTAERAPTDEIRHVSASPEEVASARKAADAAIAAAKRKEEQADIEPGPGGLLPASAGDNGTFDEAPAGPSREIAAVTMSEAAGLPPERSALLLGRHAIAPAGAPLEVERAISAANAIVGRPYIWGGGHGSWNDRGYDCSGAVSYALGGAGLLGAPVDSSALMDWGEPGRGKWITVYANPGHTYAVIAGLRWDTVGEQRGTGPKWHAELPYPDGYVARHPPGL
jgi:cell wall-associated NlpC family hydrolase